MKKTFYSNGKLLLTGEYTVLDGARALALPTTYGQYLDIEEADTDTHIRWTSLDSDGTIWFKTELPLEAIFQNKQHSTPETNTLVSILHQAHKANPLLLENAGGFNITTRLTFPRHWGLGSSSTLINNIAQWFGINAFELLNNSFGGSGYDIACAQNNTPILYRLNNGQPAIEPINFSPVFAGNICFVYLNRKQNSREAIASYKERRKDISEIVCKINTLTQALPEAKTIADFTGTLEVHETIMSEVLNMTMVKQSLFPDFTGTIKSLGAWGGDFVMAVSENNPVGYFKEKGYEVVISYKQMILAQ